MIDGPRRVPAAAWLTRSGPDQDVAVSTRCRIARNLPDVPFPWRASPDQLRQACHRLLAALAAVDPAMVLVEREWIALDTLQALIRNRYCSAAWGSSPRPGAVGLAADGTRAAMVHEEDHLRLQSLLPGLSERHAAEDCGAWAKEIDARAPFAHDPVFGFLTAAPQHAGAGLRIGVLLHLAALGATGEIVEAADAAVCTGCVVRGAFGEGTRGIGGFYQLSTTASGKQDPTGAVDQAGAAARYLVDKERAARERVFGSPAGRADLLAASAGARDRLVSEDLAPDEALRAVSAIRLSIAMGVTNGSIVRTGNWIGRCAASLCTQGAEAMGGATWRAVLADTAG